MVEEIKKSDRDKVLISILERMADQIGKQDTLLSDIVKQQGEYALEVQNASLHRRSLQMETEKSIDKLQEALSRYRADMLSIVNEQDNINRNISELNRIIGQATFQFEFTNNRLIEIDDRVKKQEKGMSEQNEALIKQTEQIPKDIFEASRREIKLHAETEKRLNDIQHEVATQVDKLQKDVARRLKILEDIDSSFQLLIFRTEPPEKKPPAIVTFIKRKFRQIRRLVTRSS